MTRKKILVCLGSAMSVTLVMGFVTLRHTSAQTQVGDKAAADAISMFNTGRQIFRFDTFGDENFWGGQLKLHQAIAGSLQSGVGPGLSPRTGLNLGLKVDVDLLPQNVIDGIRSGSISLDNPATTVALLKLNSVVGLTGVFSGDKLQSLGIQCALCHSTVDNSSPAFCGNMVTNPGTGCIGHRLDGWPNRDLNVGQIVALAPDLSPFTKALGVDEATVRGVLQSWGPGKFDAELILDGKATNPNTGRSAATLIPPAFGLAGVNLSTWTGWGSVTHWNAFVANLEMHGVGRFADSRLNGADGFVNQFPLAVTNGFANLNPNLKPDDDQITSKLPALHFYQLALASPDPPANSFDAAAAKRGDELFSGKAQCNNCHVEPIWTEPGWNMHPPKDICIDSFQANRAPDRAYRTSPLGGLFAHQKGGFYHDGRFATLSDVVAHYNTCMSLGLTQQESNDVVQYLLSLGGVIQPNKPKSAP